MTEDKLNHAALEREAAQTAMGSEVMNHAAEKRVEHAEWKLKRVIGKNHPQFKLWHHLDHSDGCHITDRADLLTRIACGNVLDILHPLALTEQKKELDLISRPAGEPSPYANRSDSTLILILTEKDAEIAELTRQLNESRDALGKEKAALNQTLKKVGPLENSLIGLRDSVRSMMEKQPSSLTGFERIREAMAVSEKVLPPLGLSTTL